MQEKSRRILILATSYAPLIGGAELAVQNITDRLSGFSFDLITSLPFGHLPREERIGNVNVFRAGPSSGGMSFFLPKIFLPLAIFFKAKSLLSHHSYDLIYVLQASQAGGAAWLLRNFSRTTIPMVLNLQEGKDLNHQPSLIRYFRRIVIKAADYYIVISSYLRDFLISQGISSSRIFLIPNGVDLGSVRQNPDIHLKQKLGLRDERVIITVSRLVEKNGIADLIEGFAKVTGEYPEPLKLIIVGAGDLMPGLKDQAENLGLSKDIIFVGSIDPQDVPAYLSLADIFVRPSRTEGLGTAFLEAMAANVPVIGTPVGGIVDFLTDGHTGLFCKVGDPSDIAGKILMLLRDEPMRQKITQEGRKLVEEKYTWESIAREFKTCYDIITNR